VPFAVDSSKTGVVTNLNADMLDGLHSTSFALAGTVWELRGNANTDPSLNFLGTTDQKPVVFRSNKFKVLSLEWKQGASGTDQVVSANVIGVPEINSAHASAIGVVIGGGGAMAPTGPTTSHPNKVSQSFAAIVGGTDNAIGSDTYSANTSGSFIGGGASNSILDNVGMYALDFATIVGGLSNTVRGDYGFIGGGQNNIVGRTASAICGGAQNQATNDYSFVGGGYQNQALGVYSGVAGGDENTVIGHYSFVGGGSGNNVSDDFSFIGGGTRNSVTVNAQYAAIVGGSFNSVQSTYAFIGAGQNNRASGTNAFVGGGYNNTASGAFASVAGGFWNTASGDASFAGGAYANATKNGCFVWRGLEGWDSENPLSCEQADQFLVRAKGGVKLCVDVGKCCSLQLVGGVPQWDCAAFPSDRNSKLNITEVDPLVILERVASLEVSTWSYKDVPTVKHIGPMAQDFYDLFGFGASRETISPQDLIGVTLAAVQGLNIKVDSEVETLKRQVEEQNREIEQLRGEIAQLKAMLGFQKAR
jgi:hypothetical protein